MKFLKWLLIIIVVIVATIMIYGATQPPQMKVAESIEIDATASQVFEEIVDFESWDKWSAWSKMDTAMDQKYKGNVGEVGYKNSWNSENWKVGIGSQEIVEIRKNEYMKTKMLFNGSGKANYASFTLTENEGKTTVVWDMVGAETPFYARIMNTLMKPMITESYQTSLKELKMVVESKPVEVPNPMGLEVVEVKEINIISIRDTTTSAGIGAKLTELYTELSIYMSIQGKLEMAGMPIGMYHSYSEEMVDMEAAFPIVGEAQSNGRVKVGSIPSGKALKGIFMGDYDASGEMHIAMENYVNANTELEFDKLCWEVYANDPTEVDSADVRTEIYYQLK